MSSRLPLACALALELVASSLLSVTAASATSSFVVTGTFPASISATLPLLRLHFNAPTSAQKLPVLRTQPTLTTEWQQIGARDVQAVVLSKLTPSVAYTISVPTRMTCATTCSFSAVLPHVATVAAGLTYEAQLLAELNYLPVSFRPTSPASDPTQAANGSFSWKYVTLPLALKSQWQVGVDNVVLRGALMNFQVVNGLPTSGVADAATWAALVSDVATHRGNSGSYNYVVVSETSPETTTLYVDGHLRFRTLANTGIAVSPTATGTYPIYLRYLTQTMKGTNPDGTHYSDPGIPWVSYFHGGDALHGFLRSSYGSPQSLGCVEMTFDAAKVLWPYTPIGTLVSVTA